MKHILLTLILAAFCGSAYCQSLTVDGNMNVIVGGSNFGRAEDYIVSHPKEATDVMLAIRAFNAQVKADADKQVADANTASDAAIAKAKEDADKAVAAAAEKAKEIDATKTQLQADAKAAEDRRLAEHTAKLAELEQAKALEAPTVAALEKANLDDPAIAKIKADGEAGAIAKAEAEKAARKAELQKQIDELEGKVDVVPVIKPPVLSQPKSAPKKKHK